MSVSEQSVHDSTVYAYSVLCEQRRIILHTEYRHGEAEEYTDVIFLGVVAHHFESVLAGNILFGIEQVEVDRIVQEWAGLFAAEKNYGWPDLIRYADPAELISVLRQRRILGWEVSSSLGLSGWVMAEKMDIASRTLKLETW